jgi:hypothetical protein
MGKNAKGKGCLLYMSTTEAGLGEVEPKLHATRRDAIEEAIEWIGRNPRFRAYIDCSNVQITHDELMKIRNARS